MSAVGSLIFCVSCGNLLDSVDGQSNKITCGVCQRSYSAKDFSNLKVVTRSHDDAFPSSLRLKKSAVKTSLSKSDQEANNGATIKETCEKCGNEEMVYHTLQLRSADEGATVFYTCTNCGYRYKVNN
ncbi:DNA-directed RNA polymerase I core subunit [Saccharomycopsis crataegensis]|uniref:DNA-directed RNA polymerase subunit n=1 Tax=Saccharomycopsis crataegensis TaxID=43959 RepID=A0AAV5QL69_9ASCO|nr:DNA-directed RNA polymerase I core subunit [Saccharomycopsis crataegensis]